MKKTTKEMLDSEDFRRLVATKWTASVSLTAALFALYYGYILLIAYDKPLLAAPLVEGGVATRGIVMGVAVIVGAWVLTAIYVVWANRSYDTEVDRLKSDLRSDAR